MCVKFSLNISKLDLEIAFNSKIAFDFYPIKEALPYKEFPVYTKSGFRFITWGNSNSKSIHKRKSDLKSSDFIRGVLPITGFYTWKKEKLIAPIGFGDHKETLKLHPLLISQEACTLVFIPVLIQNNTFYIIVDESSNIIKEYQPNEPLFIDEIDGWIKNERYTFSKFSNKTIAVTIL